MDYLKIEKESKVTNEFDTDERVEFSSNVKKINDYGKTQGRAV